MNECASPRLPSWPWATSAITAQRSGWTARGSTRRDRTRVRRSALRAPRATLVGHDAAHMATDDLTIRPSVPADLDQVLAVAARSLGWAADERDRAFFRWKHEENPVGAVAGLGRRRRRPGDRLPHLPALGLRGGRRAAARWPGRWTRPPTPTTRAGACSGGSRCSRSTTSPRPGVDAVFNTPNDQSRPGYLKMGWHELGPADDRDAAGVAAPAAGAAPGPHGVGEVVGAVHDRRAGRRGAGATRRWPTLAAAPAATGWSTPRIGRPTWRGATASSRSTTGRWRRAAGSWCSACVGGARRARWPSWSGWPPGPIGRRWPSWCGPPATTPSAIGLGPGHGLLPLPAAGPDRHLAAAGPAAGARRSPTCRSRSATSSCSERRVPRAVDLQLFAVAVLAGARGGGSAASGARRRSGRRAGGPGRPARWRGSPTAGSSTPCRATWSTACGRWVAGGARRRRPSAGAPAASRSRRRSACPRWSCRWRWPRSSGCGRACRRRAWRCSVAGVLVGVGRGAPLGSAHAGAAGGRRDGRGRRSAPPSSARWATATRSSVGSSARRTLVRRSRLGRRIRAVPAPALVRGDGAAPRRGRWSPPARSGSSAGLGRPRRAARGGSCVLGAVGRWRAASLRAGQARRGAVGGEHPRDDVGLVEVGLGLGPAGRARARSRTRRIGVGPQGASQRRRVPHGHERAGDARGRPPGGSRGCRWRRRAGRWRPPPWPRAGTPRGATAGRTRPWRRRAGRRPRGGR